jgi:hypothetical protein
MPTHPEPVVEYVNSHWQGAWTNGYRVVLKTADSSRPGIFRAELDVYYQGVLITTEGVDLLSATSRQTVGVNLASRNGTGIIAWADNLACFYTNLHEAMVQAGTDIWAQALTADDFLKQVEDDIDATVKDFVVPGCITLVSAPRGSGKSFVLLFLAVALAHGGVFRMESLAWQRVLLVDRDNPKDLVRKRLRALGAAGLTTLKVLTRDTAPPLTDTAGWATFPTDDYDVLLVDSISAFTEGVSEKEGKQTQEFLATLKNLAERGLAILALANTNKAGTNIRGRGEQTNSVDIVYEGRNVTGWAPDDDSPYWWESLPEAGEQAWQQNTTRQVQGAALRIGFVPTKFRLGILPAPFVLEMDTTTTPWSMRDVTEQVTRDATQALQERTSAERRKLEDAAQALAAALRTRAPEDVMLKEDAERFLRDHGRLTRRQARNLLDNGYNHDIHADGLWVLRELTGRRGHPVGIYPVARDPRARGGEEKENGGNRWSTESPQQYTLSENPISATGLPSSGGNVANISTSNGADSGDDDFRHQPNSARRKSTPIAPAETQGETDMPDFRRTSPTPTGPLSEITDGLVAGVVPPLLPPSCPGCGRTSAWLIRPDYYACASCQYKWLPPHIPRS